MTSEEGRYERGLEISHMIIRTGRIVACGKGGQRRLCRGATPETLERRSRRQTSLYDGLRRDAVLAFPSRLILASPIATLCLPNTR